MNAKLIIFFLLTSAFALDLNAGSGTWLAHPTDSDWNNPENWSSNTIPNSPSDIATFGSSSVTAVSIINTDIDVDSLVFNSGASPYAIAFQIPGLEQHNLSFYGAGVINNSGVMQSIVLSNASVAYVQISFYNTASTGEMTTFSTTAAGHYVFYDSSSAGSATFNLIGGVGGTVLDFLGGATAADATINSSNGAVVVFSESSVGSNATINLNSPSSSYLEFVGSSNAEHLKVNCNETYGVLFLATSSAGEGTFMVNPGKTTTQTANTIYFADSATASNATFILNGSMGAGFLSSTLLFYDSATAGNANIVAYGGSNGGPGAAIQFRHSSDGGTASMALLGNSTLYIGGKQMGPPVTLGSLSGSGTVYLGARALMIGSNNASTTFAGIIQDNGATGSLRKVGTGTLILTGANLYTGGTIVRGGILELANQDGSATGPAPVEVNRGTVAGSGTIAGATTIGIGSGKGAFLAPATGSVTGTTLTLQSALTMNSDATYICSFKAKDNKARTDLVKANGVTINGAQLNLVGQINDSLRLGLTLTIISNTSANPISGTFANLPDGGTVNVSGTNFQASYTGGDGNDLSLTVVP